MDKAEKMMSRLKGKHPASAAPENHAAFEAFYEAHKNQVYKFACYLTGDRREAEDLFQETWLRVAQHFHSAPDKNNVKSWILTIAVNLHRDILRKKRIRGPFFVRRTDVLEYNLEAADSAWGVKDSGGAGSAERAETARAIDKALTALPDRQRRVFVLKEVEGFKHSEISEMLDLPVGTIKSLLFRAVQRLRHELRAFKPGASKELEMEKCGVKTSNG